MNIFTKYGLITAVLVLAACAPVEQKPVITAPPKPEPTTLEIIEIKPQAPISEEVVEEVPKEMTEEVVEEAPEEVLEEIAEEISEAIKEPVAQAQPAPAPLPDPYDPAELIGASSASLAATLGRHDHSFDNSGMNVHHYRQDTCLMLVFINDADEVTHIDLRHNLVNQEVDITACHHALGARKAALP